MLASHPDLQSLTVNRRGGRTLLPASRYLAFDARFIWAALVIAVFAGFGIGAHMAFIIGYGLPLHTGFQTYIQLHGHLQLFGWAGLFVIGVSLHFLPRLTSVSIRTPLWPSLIFYCLASGLVLRAIAHSVLPYFSDSTWFAAMNWLGAGAALLEWTGIYFYLMLILWMLLNAKNRSSAGFVEIRPFMLMQLFGWGVSGLILLGSTLGMAASASSIINPAWNQVGIDLFIGLTLLPISFAMSAKTFPLYFRLTASGRWIRPVAYTYLLGLALQILPSSPLLIAKLSPHTQWIAAGGTLLKAVAIIVFVLRLDILTRARPPWTVNRVREPGPDRRPTRGVLPDYGEFGRFERLIYAAYWWLILGALFEIFYATADLLNLALPHKQDMVRHLYLLGFISLLILGMAVRMLPGFMGKRRIASALLVDASFWLGNLAVACRILPLIFTFPMFSTYGGLIHAAGIAFGWSGVAGILAVGCLAINLWRTAKQKK